MAGVNDFLPFAQGVGQNVISQNDFAAAPWVPTGFLSGIAQSDQLNKVWRQGSTISYAVAKFIIDQLPTEDVLDNGDGDAIAVQIAAAVSARAGVKPGRIVTASTTLTIVKGDGIIGLNRTVGPAAMNANLPANAVQFQEFEISDIAGNFFDAPVTFVPPAGTINGAANWVANQNRQRVGLTYWGGNIWTAY